KPGRKRKLSPGSAADRAGRELRGAAPVLERSAHTGGGAGAAGQARPSLELAGLARVELRSVAGSLDDGAGRGEPGRAEDAAVLDHDHGGEDDYGCGDNATEHGVLPAAADGRDPTIGLDAAGSITRSGLTCSRRSRTSRRGAPARNGRRSRRLGACTRRGA